MLVTDSSARSGPPAARRPDWDEYFMKIAAIVATRSTCIRRQVGCVITRGKRILSTGYNGAPAGLRHCTDDPSLCLRAKLGVPSGQRAELCRALHAEQNALIQAAVHAVSTTDGWIYVTHQPCVICAKMIINAGIRRVVFTGDYPDEYARGLFDEAGTELVHLVGEEEKR
jgi:dCMP deaminase